MLVARGAGTRGGTAGAVGLVVYLPSPERRSPGVISTGSLMDLSSGVVLR